MRLVVLGGPGAGKGTLTSKLAKSLAITLISVGEILRTEIFRQTDLGNQAKSYVEKGELVPDEIMIQFMRQRLLEDDVSKGWVLDGYPRTAFQAEELDFLLEELGQPLNWAIYLEVSEAVMIERSLNRGHQDDQAEIIARRIEMFKKRTIPILEYYSFRNLLLTINSEKSSESIEQEIINQILSH